MLNLDFRVLDLSPGLALGDLCRRHSQVGSLAGAVHLLNANAGVPRWAQWEQKSHVDEKAKSSLDFDFQYEYKLWKHGLSVLYIVAHTSRGVRKVTTGITGLWQPSVHSDVAFWSFDVGSSYHSDAGALRGTQGNSFKGVLFKKGLLRPKERGKESGGGAQIKTPGGGSLKNPGALGVGIIRIADHPLFVSRLG